MALKLSIIKKWSLAAPHLCDIKCEQEITGQSYNYNRKYKMCELNNRTKKARPQDFIFQPPHGFISDDWTVRIKNLYNYLICISLKIR